MAAIDSHLTSTWLILWHRRRNSLRLPRAQS